MGEALGQDPGSRTRRRGSGEHEVGAAHEAQPPAPAGRSPTGPLAARRCEATDIRCGRRLGSRILAMMTVGEGDRSRRCGGAEHGWTGEGQGNRGHAASYHFTVTKRRGAQDASPTSLSMVGRIDGDLPPLAPEGGNGDSGGADPGQSLRIGYHTRPSPAGSLDVEAMREKRSTYCARWRSPRNSSSTREWAAEPSRSASRDRRAAGAAWRRRCRGRADRREAGRRARRRPDPGCRRPCWR
jgi:hypothetical protein